MNTIITDQPPIVGRRTRTSSENTLLDLTRSRALWIWTPETQEQPNAPDNEQRAFRKLYNYQANRGRPTSLSIMVAADDFGAMYVNGVLASPANPNLDWTVIVGYEIPLPIVEGDNSTSLLLAFRVINRGGMAGLLAGVQVNYEDAAPPDVFYTGSDQTWLGERLFQEHWEHPIFNTNEVLSSWRPAIVFPADVRPPSRPGAVGDEVVVLGRLPPLQTAVTAPPGNSSGLDGGESCSKQVGVELSVGGFAGVIIATALVAMLLGALASWFVTKKRHSKTVEYYEGVAPQTFPGRQVPPYLE